MFRFFKKKQDQELAAPANGKLIAISAVADPVFADRLLGDGFAVIPSLGEVTAPVSGIISTIFPTKHAIGLTTDAGDEVLVHMGIDTVQLEGKPFCSYVKAGQKVTTQSVLATVDLEMLAQLEKDPAIIVVFTNGRSLADLEIRYDRQVVKGESLAKLD